jgi:3-oxoacyl-[acyl-carrier-protein] synthase II
VHGVTGSSRTFMGEEAAGVDAARIALTRIAAGQSDIALIGGSQNGERKDLLVLYEFGGFNLKDKFAPVWARGEPGGFALGSGGAFIVIESKAHAEARGAKPFARLVNVVADMTRRKHAGDVTSTLDKLWAKLGKVDDKAAIITGATGVEPATSEERAFLKAHANLPVRATGTMFGHTMEAQFPLGLAVAALSLSRGALFAPDGTSAFEVEMSGSPSQIVVIGTGHWRGEGMALVEAIK